VFKNLKIQGCLTFVKSAYKLTYSVLFHCALWS